MVAIGSLFLRICCSELACLGGGLCSRNMVRYKSSKVYNLRSIFILLGAPWPGVKGPPQHCQTRTKKVYGLKAGPGGTVSVGKKNRKRFETRPSDERSHKTELQSLSNFFVLKNVRIRGRWDFRPLGRSNSTKFVE